MSDVNLMVIARQRVSGRIAAYRYGIVHYRRRSGPRSTASVPADLYERACAALGGRRAREVMRNAAMVADGTGGCPSSAAAAALVAVLEASHA
jgi:hypothetical protein